MPIDTATLKQNLPISTVLRAHGHTPRHNRLPCPLHGGDNRSAFSIKPGDQYARCWACGWHGDAIALEHALGGGTLAQAMQRCAQLAGLRPRKPWERKPWLERQRRQRAHAQRIAERIEREWQHEAARALVAEIADAHAEVAAAGAVLASDPESAWGWAWLDAAVMARERAEWAAVAAAHARTVARCGEAGRARIEAAAD